MVIQNRDGVVRRNVPVKREVPVRREAPRRTVPSSGVPNRGGPSGRAPSKVAPRVVPRRTVPNRESSSRGFQNRGPIKRAPARRIVEPYKSRGEKLLAGFFKEAGIKFHYEYPILIIDEDKKIRVWYPDFWLPQLSIVVEYFGMVND